jgi:integrase/recombinase XerD
MNWEQAISAYKSYLQIERGLSKNAVESYIFDIKKLPKSVSSNAKTLPITIDKDTVLEGYL